MNPHCDLPRRWWEWLELGGLMTKLLGNPFPTSRMAVTTSTYLLTPTAQPNSWFRPGIEIPDTNPTRSFT